jgi:hypothetical protein
MRKTAKKMSAALAIANRRLRGLGDAFLCTRPRIRIRWPTQNSSGRSDFEIASARHLAAKSAGSSSFPNRSAIISSPDLFAHMVQGAKQLGLHGADAQVQCLGDFFQFHFFRKPQNEHFSLPGGQIVHSPPDCVQLFPREQRSFRRGHYYKWFGTNAGRALIFKPQQSLPKSRPPISSVISNQIYGDPNQPGLNVALAAKALHTRVGAEETLLRQVVRVFRILEQEQQHSIDLSLIPANDFLEVLGADRPGTFLSLRCQRRE